MYSRAILIIFLISMTCYPLKSKVYTIHNAHDSGYVDWPSWATYLHHHPGYKSYQPFTDIKKYGCNWGSWVTFPQKIEAIQARVGYISNPCELFRSKDFLIIYKHPDYYKQAFYKLSGRQAIYFGAKKNCYICHYTFEFIFALGNLLSAI